jgi:hypothetical protein
MVMPLNKKGVWLFSVLMFLNMLLLIEFCVAPVTVPLYPSDAPEIVSVKINSDHKYYPPTYSTDPYTGTTIETFPARIYPKGTIEITIKNRHFKPYTDKDGNQVNIYYTIFAKRTSGVDEDYTPNWNYELKSTSEPAYVGYQSDTDYTVVTFTYGDSTGARPRLAATYEGEFVHFRVQAVTGYFIHSDELWDRNAVYEGKGSEPATFRVTIPVTGGKLGPTTSTTVFPPRDTFSQWLNIAVAVVFGCIIVILLLVIAYQYERRQTKHTIRTNPINHDITHKQ